MVQKQYSCNIKGSKQSKHVYTYRYAFTAVQSFHPMFHIPGQVATFRQELRDANTGRFSKNTDCISMPPLRREQRSIIQFAFRTL